MKTRIGICIWCIPSQGIEKSVQWAAENGLQGIELDLGEEKDGYPLSHPEIRSQYDALRSRWNIIYPTLGVNALCTFGMSVSSHQAKAKEAITLAVEAAEALKIPLLQLPSFVNGEIHSGEGFQNTVACLRHACRAAAGNDLLVGSENVLSVADQLRLLEEVDHPKLRLYFDTRNPLHMQGFDVAPILERVYPHVCEVHLKDGVDGGPSTLLGKGNSGFLRSMEVLIQHRYNGWMVLENDYRQIAVDSGMSAEDAIRSDIVLVQSLMA